MSMSKFKNSKNHYLNKWLKEKMGVSILCESLCIYIANGYFPFFTIFVGYMERCSERI